MTFRDLAKIFTNIFRDPPFRLLKARTFNVRLFAVAVFSLPFDIFSWWQCAIFS